MHMGFLFHDVPMKPYTVSRRKGYIIERKTFENQLEHNTLSRSSIRSFFFFACSNFLGRVLLPFPCTVEVRNVKYIEEPRNRKLLLNWTYLLTYSARVATLTKLEFLHRVEVKMYV